MVKKATRLGYISMARQRNFSVLSAGNATFPAATDEILSEEEKRRRNLPVGDAKRFTDPQYGDPDYDEWLAELPARWASRELPYGWGEWDEGWDPKTMVSSRFTEEGPYAPDEEFSRQMRDDLARDLGQQPRGFYYAKDDTGRLRRYTTEEGAEPGQDFEAELPVGELPELPRGTMETMPGEESEREWVELQEFLDLHGYKDLDPFEPYPYKPGDPGYHAGIERLFDFLRTTPRGSLSGSFEDFFRDSGWNIPERRDYSTNITSRLWQDIQKAPPDSVIEVMITLSGDSPTIFDESAIEALGGQITSNYYTEGRIGGGPPRRVEISLDPQRRRTSVSIPAGRIVELAALYEGSGYVAYPSRPRMLDQQGGDMAQAPPGGRQSERMVPSEQTTQLGDTSMAYGNQGRNFRRDFNDPLGAAQAVRRNIAEDPQAATAPGTRPEASQVFNAAFSGATAAGGPAAAPTAAPAARPRAGQADDLQKIQRAAREFSEQELIVGTENERYANQRLGLTSDLSRRALELQRKMQPRGQRPQQQRQAQIPQMQRGMRPRRQ